MMSIGKKKFSHGVVDVSVTKAVAGPVKQPRWRKWQSLAAARWCVCVWVCRGRVAVVKEGVERRGWRRTGRVSRDKAVAGWALCSRA